MKIFLLLLISVTLISCNKNEDNKSKKEIKKEVKELKKVDSELNPEEKREFKEIKSLIKTYKYKKALTLLAKLSKKHPNNAEFYYLIAIVSKNSSPNLLKTINLLKEVVKLDSKHFKSWSLLGELYFLRKNDKKAIEAWNKALEIKPKDKNLLYKVGYLYYTIRDYKKAVEYFEKSVEVDPKHFWSYYYLSELYLEFEKKPEKAIKILKDGLKNSTKNKEILTKLGLTYLKSKNYKEAIIWFKKALEYSKDDSFIMEKLSDTYLLLKDYENAINTMKSIVDSRKNSSYHINKLAQLYIQTAESSKEDKKYLVKAIDILNYLIKIDSKPEYKYSLGKLYIKLNMKKELNELLLILKKENTTNSYRYRNYLINESKKSNKKEKTNKRVNKKS